MKLVPHIIFFSSLCVGLFSFSLSIFHPQQSIKTHRLNGFLGCTQLRPAAAARRIFFFCGHIMHGGTAITVMDRLPPFSLSCVNIAVAASIKGGNVYISIRLDVSPPSASFIQTDDGGFLLLLHPPNVFFFLLLRHQNDLDLFKFIFVYLMQDGRKLGFGSMQGIPLIASSPVRHGESSPGGSGGGGSGGGGINPVEVHAFAPPWKALAEFALHNDLERIDPSAPHFQQLINQVQQKPKKKGFIFGNPSKSNKEKRTGLIIKREKKTN